LTAPRLALPPGGFENTGAGLEPKKSRLRRDGKPFRRDPVATEIRIQVIYHILWPPTLKGEQPYLFIRQNRNCPE